MRLQKQMRLKDLVAVGILVSLSACAMSITIAELEKKDARKYHAVIIRAAGYIPGTKKPEVPDAITHPTSKPGNTYVFSDKLAEKLAALGIETRVVDFSQCRNLKCIYHSDTERHRQVVNIIIFAGPSYGSKLPKQLQNLVQKLKEVARQNRDIICSSLTSAKYPDKGRKTMEDFDNRLKQAGVKTITGIVLIPNIGKEELDKKTENFAANLIAETRKLQE